MNFFDYIRDWFIWATNVLVNAAMDAYGSWLPLDWLGNALSALSDFTAEVAGGLWTASNWYEDTIIRLREILSWETIKSFIRGFWPGIDAANALVTGFTTEVLSFIDNPITYLRDKTLTVIIPWAIEHIPFISTLYTWYLNYKTELELFFDDPVQYLRDKTLTVIIPWAIEHIPFVSTLYSWYINYRVELQLFFDDPSFYLRDKFENNILPWAKENVPFFSTLAVWVDTYGETISTFFEDPVKWLEENTILGDVKIFLADPLEWLLTRFTDWFLGPEA